MKKHMLDFNRVKHLPPYVFEQVNRLKAKARAAGAHEELIRHVLERDEIIARCGACAG